MNQKPYLIAEIAQAHDGSLGILHSYIDAVAKTGVHAIKFQMHIAESESSIHEPFRVSFSREDATRYDYWKRMEFTLAKWKGIKQHCDEVLLIRNIHNILRKNRRILESLLPQRQEKTRLLLQKLMI
jgi:N-acetylneuraminate synthase